MLYTKTINVAESNLTLFESVILYIYLFFILGGNAVVLISGDGDDRSNSIFVLSWLTVHLTAMLLVFRSSIIGMLRERTVLLYSLFFLLSVFWSREPSKTLAYSGMLMLNVFFAYFLASRLSLEKFLSTVWKVVTFMVAAGLLLWLIGYENVRYFDPHLRSNILGLDPIRGLFAHKIMAALYANIGLFLTVIFLSGIIRLIVIFMFVLFIAMTGSSTGIVIFFFFLGVYYLYKYIQLNKVSLTLFFAYFFVLSLMVVAGAYFYLTDILVALGRDPTLTGRTLLWEWGLRAWSERFYLGWGFLGYFESNSYFNLQMNYDVFDNYDVPHFHNSYVQTLVDFGAVGGILLIYCIGYSFVNNYRLSILESNQYNDAAQVILIVLVLVSSTMHLFFNYNHFATFTLFYLYFNSRLSSVRDSK